MGGIGESTHSIDRAGIARAAEALTVRAAAGGSPNLAARLEDIRRIVACINAGDTDLEPAADPEALPPLLDELRFELIGGWSSRPEPPSADTILATLGAVENVRIELVRRASRRESVLPSGHDFAAGVAHDLRSPLTSILFLAETLQSGQSGPTNDAQRRQLGIIYSAALGLVSVASDIIELVRGGDGLTEREPTVFSVTEILESVRDIVRPMAEEKGLGVHLFPPADDHRLGYSLALSRVLLNLTTNALKFTDSGIVEIAVRATGPMGLEFSVRDTGRGYDPEALETLYEPFRRTTAGDRFGFSGTGLGLAISRKLVAAMGSNLEVETRPRWGTRFYFEVALPPAPGAVPPPAA